MTAFRLADIFMGDYGWLLKRDVLRNGPHKLEEITRESRDLSRMEMKAVMRDPAPKAMIKVLMTCQECRQGSLESSFPLPATGLPEFPAGNKRQSAARAGTTGCAPAPHRVVDWRQRYRLR